MIKRGFAAFTAAVLFSTALSAPAQAAVYTSEAAFTAANTVTSTVSFSDVATGLTPVGSPYVKDGVTFTGLNLKVVDTSFWGSVDSLLDDTFNGSIDFSFAAAQAVGFYVAGSYGDSSISISFFDGADLLFAATPVVGGVNTAFSFYGIDGLGDITRVRLDSAGIPNGFASVGPISFATGAVPEPATWGLMILGVGAVGAAARRRRATVSAARFA